jgi:hypothetical protein
MNRGEWGAQRPRAAFPWAHRGIPRGEDVPEAGEWVVGGGE